MSRLWSDLGPIKKYLKTNPSSHPPSASAVPAPFPGRFCHHQRHQQPVARTLIERGPFCRRDKPKQNKDTKKGVATPVMRYLGHSGTIICGSWDKRKTRRTREEREYFFQLFHSYLSLGLVFIFHSELKIRTVAISKGNSVWPWMKFRCMLKIMITMMMVMAMTMSFTSAHFGQGCNFTPLFVSIVRQ